MEVRDKNVLVTGASKGFGFKIAETLIKEGANLFICSSNQINIKKAYNFLNKDISNNQKLIFDNINISNYEDVIKLKNNFYNNFPHCDVLINNVGIYGPLGSFLKIDINDWINAININLIGSCYVVKEFLPYMKKNKKGKIIQISGGGATNPMPNISSYAASKSAIVRFMETLALELKEYRIDVNSVAPGALNTDMLEQVLKAGPKVVGNNFYNKCKIQKRKGDLNIEKAIKLIIFLASDLSNGITGKLISAQWDNWKKWPLFKKELSESNAYTIRRIVGKDDNLGFLDI